MRKSFVAFFAVLAFIACLTFSRNLSLRQDLGQVHEICSPHEGRCLTIRQPKVPAVPNWKMPRTRDGKPAFTGVYAGAGFNHQFEANHRGPPIIRGFAGTFMPPTEP